MRNDVKNIRLKLGLTRPDFAELMDIHYSTAANWETQQKNPKLKNCYKLIDIANRFGIKLLVQEIIFQE